MKRLIMMTILKMVGKAVLLTMVIGIVIGVIGNRNQWDSIAYSNAFFIAGGLLIVAGAFSRLVAGQEWGVFQSLYAESFRQMSSGERAKFIVDASDSANLLILGLLSGVLLILISWFVTKMF
jgi:hypothetical protein